MSKDEEIKAMKKRINDDACEMQSLRLHAEGYLRKVDELSLELSDAMCKKRELEETVLAMAAILFKKGIL